MLNDSTPTSIEQRYAAQRARLNLDCSQDAIDAASAYPPDQLVGIPLTPREHRLIESNVNAGPVVESITKLLEPIGLFGGIWINDDDPVGITVVLAGTASDIQLSELSKLAGSYPLTYIQRDVAYSTLTDIQAKIASSDWKKQGFIAIINPDMKTSRVIVGVTPNAPADTGSQLQAAFGDLVRIVPDTPFAKALSKGHRRV